MTVQIQVRRDTAANWTAANPVLADGEAGYETDTGKIKYGDGATAWNSLAYRFTGGGGGIAAAAGTQTATSGTVVFSNSNGITFGMAGSTQVTASHNGLTTAAQSNHSHNFATTTTNGSLIVVGTTNSAGATIGVPAFLTTQSVQTQASGAIAGSGYTSSTQAGSTVGATHNSAGLSMLWPPFLTTAQTPGAYLTTARASNDAVGLNTALTANGVAWTVNSSGISLNVPAFLTTAALSADSSKYAGTGTTLATTGIAATLGVGNNGVALSLSVPGGTDTWFATGTNTIAGTATSGSFSNDGYVISGAGILSVGVSSNTLVLSVPSGGGGGDGFNEARFTNSTANSTMPLVWAGNSGGSGNVTIGLTGSTITMSAPAGGGGGFAAGMSNVGNTTGTSGTVGSQIVFVGVGEIALSQSVNGNSATISIYEPPSYISSFQNLPAIPNTSVLTFGMTSLSQAAAFNMPRDGSFSFLRLPVTMSTNSTTIATLASATATGQAGLFHTFNAVVYSLGTGASSQSLISVASGSAGMSFTNQISITNSTQYSVSMGITGNALGGAANTSRTTQYSISNTNYSLTTNWATEWTAGRFLDIPFAASLSGGPYWIVVGGSSSTSSAGAVAGMSACHVRYSGHYGASNVNVGFGVMGSTNMSSGGQLGNGFFSTAGGGTTSGFPISAISSTASNPVPYFQLLRSA